MKQAFAIAIAAALCLTTACSSSPSSNRYIETEQAIETSLPASEQPQNEQTQSEQPAEAELQQPDASASPAPLEPTPTTKAKEEEEEVEQPSAKPSEPPPKQTKSEKAQTAQKNNASISKAVTDSIMDNGDDKAAAKDPKSEQLKTSIEHIRGLVKDLKQHAENNDTSKIVDVSSRIVQDWDGMKADVTASYPDMVDFLQEKINKLNELQAVETIDTKAVIQLDYELYQAFRQLADKAGV
ncbi:hypothetical protein [Paenibacillus sp. LHD-38]|uniref:hypothetical protein n=1 Tax=Paenibacillus sp. LHD-38 TaxID=3072143 RepID=UPI00280CA2B6|nr:hypothetical protein [Paenibacillus sp. LHD-38]MDQ8738890.1 hypothetical protein [Paenibacillus sp. LHD-38]